jgi:hypothetical protein
MPVFGVGRLRGESEFHVQLPEWKSVRPGLSATKYILYLKRYRKSISKYRKCVRSLLRRSRAPRNLTHRRRAVRGNVGEEITTERRDKMPRR